MKFNPINLYKLHLNSANNLSQGDETGRFTLQLPQYFPKNKRCFVFVEHASLHIKKSNTPVPQHENLGINSNLISPNSYSNNNKNLTGILCYFGKDRESGILSGDKFIELQIPTNPINIGYLPNQIELYISNPILDVQVVELSNGMYFELTLCCQFVDNDEC